MSNFRPINRDIDFLMPPSVDEWLPQRHLPRFVVEVIEGLDLRAMTGSYRGSGEASYHPRLLLGLIIYGYASGVFSSRNLERATYDSVAFRFIAANEHPDHDTIATFRRRFLKQIEALFVEVLSVAREMGVLKLGTVALDGTKIHANASRHSALSYEHASRIEAQLKAEVADLLGQAEAADQAELPDRMQVPEELARREKRLSEIARAKAVIEARAKERHAREQAEYEAKMAARDAKVAQTGKKPGGRVPQPPAEGPLPTDRLKLPPAARHRHDPRFLVRQFDLGKIAELPAELGKVGELLADNGYFSEGNVNACAAAGIETVIAMGREAHHPTLAERFAEDPAAPENPTPVEAMRHRLQTKEGKKRYALRKQTPEPVFGIIKSVLGFRQFLLRGLDKVRGEWSLVTMAWNMKRMSALAGAN